MFAKFTNLFSTQKPELPPKKEMGLLKDFDPGVLPSKDMKRFTKEINELISQYNKTDDSEKIAILKGIQEKIKEVEYRYRQQHFAKSPGYLQAQAFLFKEIQYQYASLGTTSLAPAHSSPLTEIIANMSSEKADKLLSILVDATKDRENEGKKLNTELSNLYEKTDKSPEANAFRKFLSTHEISFLGGGNSKNFRVVGTSDGKEEVLKVDYRLSMPKNVEAHLREEITDLFTPVYAERSATCVDSKGNTINRGIVVTDYCKEGSVIDYRTTNLKEIVVQTGSIFQQMAGAMLDIQDAHCMFPDAKITNWLVDEKGNIRIGDTKSFLFTDEQGKYKSDIPGNEYCSFLNTPDFVPPEFLDSSFDADAAHAYILGKNLYYFTSGKVGEIDDGAKFDFNRIFFKIPDIGPAYRTLIEALVKPDPAKRMPVREALDQLFIINNPAFRDVFTELKALKFGENDKIMNQYIRERQQSINATSDAKEQARILLDLKKTVTALKNDKAAQEVRDIIDDYRATAGLFTVGKNAKANRIEQSMSQLSIEERCHFMDTPKSKDVMKAIASHRHWGKSGKVYLTETGEIDTEKAAKHFKDFKVKFNEQLKKEPKTEQIEEKPTKSLEL